MNRSPDFDSAKSLDASGDPRDTAVMQLTEIDPVRLNRLNPELNMARFYEIDLQPNLFGEVSVLRSWGRIGTKGQAMMVTCADAQEAVAAAGRLERQKRRRGYLSSS